MSVQEIVGKYNISEEDFTGTTRLTFATLRTCVHFSTGWVCNTTPLCTAHLGQGLTVAQLVAAALMHWKHT